MLPARPRILISIVVGLTSGFLCSFFMRRLGHGTDFTWSVHLAQRLLQHQNPYDTPLEQYPIIAGFFALPFVRFPPAIAAGIFYGISSGVLAFGLTREGYHKLIVFLAYPYWIGLLYVQWSPIIMAAAFFPLLMPVAMVKPQVGLPVFLTRFSLRGCLLCVVVAIGSLLIVPRWPMLWLGQLHNYQHFVALLVLPGPLILLALLRYRDRDAMLLLLTACMPQRWFFDTLILWLIPKTRREMLVTVFFSWFAGVWRWYHPPQTFDQVGRWIVLSTYLPMLAIVLLREKTSKKEGSHLK
ncbi:MAG TPA: hypothetical protein VKB49_05790 [Candidatus Sulfotelmatobacter sp.]|nr:hypothetical protein [Candidatus Sulfotelmatobacter sp.]